MNEKQLSAAGALNMLIAVGAGAFGAHGLRARVSADLLAVWQTGVQYHLVHGLGLLLIAALLPRFPLGRLGGAGMLMQIGMVLFSGSLYALTLSGVRMLGIVTPIGGLMLLGAWAWLAWAALRS